MSDPPPQEVAKYLERKIVTFNETRPPTSMKTCSKCGTEKPRSEFYRDRKARDGKTARCKGCVYTRVRRTFYTPEERRSRKLARLRVYKEENPKRARAHAWTAGIVRRLKKQGLEVPPRPGVDETMEFLAALGDECSLCGNTPNELEVDHIEPLRFAPALAFQPSNLQRLCVDCHKKKTAAER